MKRNQWLYSIMAKVYTNSDTVTMQELCNITGSSYTSFYKYMKRLGLGKHRHKRNPMYSEDKINEILAEACKPKVSLMSLHNKYGVCPATVKRWAKERNVDVSFNKKISIPEEQLRDALNNYKYMDSVSAARAAGIGRNKFRCYLKENNLLKKTLDIQRDISFDSSFFDVLDTEDKAYWFGFILADGCVRPNQLVIEIQEQDINHLKKFNQSINGNLNIRKRTRVQKSGKEVTEVNVTASSKKLCNALIEKGCVPNKTFEGELDETVFLRDGIAIPFIRGYFDGNGHVAKVGNYVRMDVNNQNYMNSLFQLIIDYVGVIPKIYRHGKSCMSITMCNRKDCSKFLNAIYRNANVYLDRKYKTYLEHEAVRGQGL